MRKSHAAVDRRSASVHHLDDRDLRLFEFGKRPRTVIDPGKNDSARIPAEKIGDQPLLAVHHVFRAGDQNLETCLWQDGMQAVQQRDIHRVLERRHDNRDERNAARRETAGGTVRNIAGSFDLIQNPLTKGLGDEVRSVECSRDRHDAHVKLTRDLLESDAAREPGGDGAILTRH